METESVNKILKAVGISGAVITGIFIVIGGFLIYKNYFEVKKLKLEITELEKQRGTKKA